MPTARGNTMPSVILVEDDSMIGDIYEKKFSSAGFDVAVMASGREFLTKIKDQKSDIVLLDMVLPDMSGIDILTELKKQGGHPGMKVFAFSNLSTKEDYDKALQAGADGYISKTQFNPSQLVDEVKRILNETHEQEKNIERLDAAETVPPENTEKGEKRKILFIEDEKAFIEIFGKKLEDEGYLVEVAENGQAGVKAALGRKFDLIITDMVMPEMTGTEVVTKLRMEEATKSVPIIVLSASSSDETVSEVQKLGISDFFVKTQIVPSDLARRVGELLQ